MNEAATMPRAALEPQAVLGGLEVRSIAKAYDRRAVLHDVSLDVHRGEVVGLLGPNGAGKTTCFYSVMGLVKPDSGRIFLDGEDITELPMYRRAILGLGYLAAGNLDFSRTDGRAEHHGRARGRRAGRAGKRAIGWSNFSASSA